MASIRSLIIALALVGSVLSLAAAAPTRLELKQGDHIALIGGALADRFQHSGWFETLVTARFPQDDLTFRNLAVAGDEVITRHRSENFGSPDEWLAKVKADVILAFFGYNESFKGDAGLEQFRADLDKWVKETLTKNYSGNGSPRIVLFSPVANERHQDRNFPDPAPNNANIQKYAQVISQVAAANNVMYVDLFAPSQQLFADAAREGRSLTVNGVYLTDTADRLLAPILFRALFGEPVPAGRYDRLRAAINEKNAQWHARYRTVDGYNVYGGRSKLVFDGITNFKVMQEEMSARDVMTANRDRRVWTLARSAGIQVDDNSLPPVDDSNVPPITQVPTNKKGENPDGTFKFLGGEEAMSKMTLAKGCKVNMFASEEQFPELINPVQMAWDTKGRLWVAAWPNYPERTPESKTGDSLLVFEDTNGDGKADRCTHFLDDLNCPTGFQFYRDGVIVVQAPDVWFVRDTDGDGKADWRERILMGMDSADSHHTANALAMDPGGAVYLSDGVFHRTQVESAWGPVRNDDAAIFRFDPHTGKFETYIAYGFANPHGKVFDYWGTDLVTDATGNNTYFAPAFSGHIDYPAKHPGMKQFWDRPSRPCPGTGILSSRQFPEEFQENFLNCNVIGFLGIFRVKVTDDGSGLKGETLEHLVQSSDPNFRPTAVSVGPDGGVYFLDWQNPIIGHMQHHIRDPNRDHGHGRIYRTVYEGRPLLKQPRIDGQPIPALLELLKEPENGTRELARIELGKHNSDEVVAAVQRWVAGLNPNDANYTHNLLEALWQHQWQNVLNMELLNRILSLSDPRARTAATRVLCYWRDRVPNSLALLRTRVADENPRVRVEAIRAASFFRAAEAADVALEALKLPMDYYLDYVLKETVRQLEPWWRKAIIDGRPVAVNNSAGLNYLLDRVTTTELLKLPRTGPVLEAILWRPGIADANRTEALEALATERRTSRVAQVLAALKSADGNDSLRTANIARLLPWQVPTELSADRARIAALTSSTQSAALRQAAWASLALADGSFDKVWAEASKSPGTLADLLNGIPRLLDSDFRAKAAGPIMALLTGTSPELRALTNSASAGGGRFVRIELPRRGTLTLAEVEVLSGGKNVAATGKARQSSTSNGGEAGRAIDGRTNGDFASGTQTHTEENQENPWWEVDLGKEQPVEAIVVWNRTEGGLGKRLDGFNLVVLDANRRETFRKAGVPAPAENVRLEVNKDVQREIQRAAMHAAVSLPSQPDATFAALAEYLGRGVLVADAAQGIRALPRAAWPKTQASTAANSLVSWAKGIPAAQRTSQDYVATIQVADDLANLLPADQATALRRELRDLRVAVYVVRTVREQMRYDTPRLVVEAGKPFEIIIENDDFMPHNLVVVKPGTREKIGTAGNAMSPEQLDSRGRAFVPRSDDVVAATKLLEAGSRETLKLTAPTQEGEYEYVCTYPGHWMQMWGQLIVTKDVDSYLQAHPQPTRVASTQPHQHGE